MRRLHLVLALCACALLVVPALALARHGQDGGHGLRHAGAGHHAARSFERTFPRPARLCRRADEGRLGKRLAGSADQVKAACAKLHTAYDSAKSAFAAAVAPPADKAKRQSARKTYRDAIRSARKTFRATISDLRRAATPPGR